MNNVKANYYQLQPWLYVASKEALCPLVLDKLGITSVINLTDDKYVDSIDIFDHCLPDQELLDTEFGKVIKKLDTIAKDIEYLRQANHTVMVCCFDGKNKCMLAAGYYLIKIQKVGHAATIAQLETAYFTDAQRSDELIEKQQIIDEQNGLVPMSTGSDLENRLRSAEERRQVRCLYLASFCKILRLVGGARK